MLPLVAVTASFVVIVLLLLRALALLLVGTAVGVGIGTMVWLACWLVRLGRIIVVTAIVEAAVAPGMATMDGADVLRLRWRWFGIVR